MYCGSRKWSLALGLVGMVGLVISNCAWAMDREEGPLGIEKVGSAIACPQYGEVVGQATFYPETAVPETITPGTIAPGTTEAIAINLEIAETIPQQRCGLMFRDRLPDDRGMGFPFDPPSPVSFWMKNVPVALDMVFLELDSDRSAAAVNHYRIVDVVTAPPCTEDPCPTYGPDSDQVAWVIELAEGRAAAMDLKKGDRVEIQRSPHSHQDH